VQGGTEWHPDILLTKKEKQYLPDTMHAIRRKLGEKLFE
jgi:hypothetical protein